MKVFTSLIKAQNQLKQINNSLKFQSKVNQSSIFLLQARKPFSFVNNNTKSKISINNRRELSIFYPKTISKGFSSNDSENEEKVEKKVNEDSETIENVEAAEKAETIESEETALTPKEKKRIKSYSESIKTEETIEKEESSKMTSELLCKLIGCKHYPINEQINFDKLTQVKCYNENDQLLGNKTFEQALEEAKLNNKDVVLRNDKLVPPVVKIMKYRVELIKRLLKKITKSNDIKLKQGKSDKFMNIPLEIEENDIQVKLEKCREILRNHSHLKLAVFGDITNDDFVYQAGNLLQYFSDELVDVGRISIKITKKAATSNATSRGSVFTKETEEEKEKEEEEGEGEETDEPKTKSSLVTNEELEAEVDEIAYKNKDVKIREKEYTAEDLEYFSCVYLEVESMIVDTSGLDYELILESESVEDMLDGLKNNSFSTDKRKKKVKSEEQIDERIEQLSQEEEKIKQEELKIESFQDKLKKLEQTLEFENNILRRITLIKEIKDLSWTLHCEKTYIHTKSIVKKTMKDFIRHVSKRSRNDGSSSKSKKKASSEKKK